MSMIVCSRCDAYIDTDFNVEGVYEDNSPFRYWCGCCVERAVEAWEPNCPVLKAYEATFPDEYAEAKAEHEATEDDSGKVPEPQEAAPS